MWYAPLHTLQEWGTMPSMRKRLFHIAKNAGQRLVRAWKWLGVLFLDIAKDLLKERYLSGINHYLDAHSSGFFGALRPALRWLLNSPFAISLLVITVVIVVVIIHAAVDESRKGTIDVNKSDKKPSEISKPLEALASLKNVQIIDRGSGEERREAALRKEQGKIT